MLSRQQNRKRGATFIFFLLVMLPLSLVGTALATEYSVAVLAHRQAGLTAEAAANAGATAFNLSSPGTLTPSVARNRATHAFNRAIEVGMFPGYAGDNAQLTSVTVSGDRQVVTVVIEFTPPPMTITSFLTGIGGRDLTGRVVRSARICNPASPPQAVIGCWYA